ncbi:MAG: hypothetical protein Q9190_007894, partial [Brigantiaea leucoxantha]
MSTQQTAKTQYIETHSIRFAYRQFGLSSQVPLVMMQHFRGTMDHWDPALINRLASQRTLLLLDNAGLGRSSGPVASSFSSWAHNVILLLQALRIQQIDLLGFSMGGCGAQMVALKAPQLVRRLVLAGTQPSAGQGVVNGDVGTFMQIAQAVSVEESRLAVEKTFYYPNERGRRVARESWDRISERSEMMKEEGDGGFLQGEGIGNQ